MSNEKLKPCPCPFCGSPPAVWNGSAPELRCDWTGVPMCVIVCGGRGLEAGAVFNVPYPFVRDLFETWGEGGRSRTLTWKPGVRHVPNGPEDSEAVADGMGSQNLAVVSVHKPGRYPTRVFYERQWVSPDGHTFGKRGKLLVKIASAFRSRATGYMHPYRLAGVDETTKFVETLWKDNA